MGIKGPLGGASFYIRLI